MLNKTVIGHSLMDGNITAVLCLQLLEEAIAPGIASTIDSDAKIPYLCCCKKIPRRRIS